MSAEIAPGVHSLGQREGGRVHAFLLESDEELILIDTLFDTDGHRVMDAVRALGRPISDLKRIVLTHAHRSHLGGAAALREACGAAVHVHEWEADIVEGNRKAQPVSIIPRRPLRAYFPLQVGLALGLGRHPPCPVDHFLAEGDRIGPLHVLDAAGHTPGHLAFYWPERRTLFSGDAVATWPEYGAGWPAFNLNLKQHMASLRRMAELDSEVVGVGHGEPLRGGAASRIGDLVDALGR